MKTYEQFLKEGVYDPNIFKAVFMAGGPGSGKSFIANRTTGGLGLKIINSDAPFERFLKKEGLSLKMPESETEKRDVERARAKKVTASKKFHAVQGRLGIIIDGTGHKFGKVKTRRNELMEYGYDTFMVFVNTSLEVAQQRNETRPRRLPPDIVEKSWKEVQGNMAYFQGLFGNANFMIVDNNKHLSPEEAKKKFKMLVDKGIKEFIRRPIKNKQAKKWIEKQKLIPKKDLKQMLKGR